MKIEKKQGKDSNVLKQSYQLVIAEKPSVAKSIAEVMGAEEKKDGYFEGNGYLISWCIGHLIELAQPEDYKEQWKKWSYESLPILPKKWKYTIKKDTKKQYNILYQLLHREDVIVAICATDAGREGELIFRLVYQMAKCKKPIKRLWISSMEEDSIKKGFQELKSGSDYDNLYASALCRQQADWLVGMNGTRLFTVLYGGKVLKIGRVQTPTLAMLVERENKIQNFKKEPYFVVHMLWKDIDAVTERIETKEQAENIVRSCQKEQAIVTAIKKEKKTISPPKLYDLTTLQRDANKFFGFTAKQTLEYTQSLYEKKIVTYPRTDSQFLSEDMEQTAKNVIKAILSSLLFEETILFDPNVKRILNSKKVSDHPAIIPTMEITRVDLAALPETERTILSLLANRLLCATGEEHLYEIVRVECSCNENTFLVSGKTILQNGWKALESVFQHSFKIKVQKEMTEEQKLPELWEGQVFHGVQMNVSEHFTNPPKRFTEDSLLAAMERAGSEDMEKEVERKGLGTPATRADIIEKLVKDGFIKREKKQLLPTEDGIKLSGILPDIIKSPKLTADWENALTLVAKGELSKEDFMVKIETMVLELMHTYQEVNEEQKKIFLSEQQVLGICPNCGGQIVKGNYGAYCRKKCGMNVRQIRGVKLTDVQIKDLLNGKKILLQGVKSKIGKLYDIYITPSGTETYHYTKNGEEKSGVQFQFVVEFPKKK